MRDWRQQNTGDIKGEGGLWDISMERDGKVGQRKKWERDK